MTQDLLRRYKNWCPDFCLEKNTKPTIRINTLKIGEKNLNHTMHSKGVILKKVSWLKNAYSVESKNDFSLSSTAEYLAGYFYIQDAASQIPAEALDPKPDEKVLDMCASPGGKTTQIAQLMENKGVLIALDIRNDRLDSLENNLARLGITNTMVYHKDAKYADDLKIMFDKVLLDAPCSGNYCLETDWLEKRSIQEFTDKSKTQKELIRSAFNVLKKGGTLVYSTCSLEKEEDEDVIEWALDNFEFELADIHNQIGESGLTERTSKCKRLWPHKTGTQGFFVAKLIKK